MSGEVNTFNKYATEYDPIKIGSIDGTDTEPHDRAILRAMYSEYIPNKKVKGDPQRSIFVGRLNPRTTQETINTEFAKFGKILHCRLVKDIVTGKSKQYAFVEYESEGGMDRALREMHKEYIDGSEVVVEQVAARRLAGWKPRRLGGGFGGRRESGQLRFGGRERPFKCPIIIKKDEDRYARGSPCSFFCGGTSLVWGRRLVGVMGALLRPQRTPTYKFLRKTSCVLLLRACLATA